MGFLSSMFDPVGAALNGGNNSAFDSIFNPGQDAFGNSGIIPSFVSNIDNSFGQTVDNFGDNVGDANLDELRNLGNHFSQNPSQLFTGVDPASTKLWNAATNQSNTPWLDQYGGETNADTQASANRGINTQDNGYMSTLAHAIAGYEAGGAIGNLGASAIGSMTGGAAGGAAGSSALSDAVGETSGGGFGSSQTAYDASQIPGYTSTGAGGYSSLDKLGANVSKGATQGAATGLDNGTNPWSAGLKGAATSGIGSNLDYAGTIGVDNPYLKNAFNGGINGGLRTAMDDPSQSGYGAFVGALGGGLQSAGNAFGNWMNQPSGSPDPSQQGNNPSAYTGGQPGQNSGMFGGMFGGGNGTGPSSTGSNNYGNLAAGLGQLYMSSRNNAGIQGQINNLSQLYGPNSAYATQMQQQLQRQDAASGRGSQYGTRSVELQAALANAAQRSAPTLANLYQQQRQNRFGELSGMFAMGKNSGMFGSSPSGSGAFSPTQVPNGSGSPMIQPGSQMPQIDPSTMNTDYQSTLGQMPQIDPSQIYGG